MGTLPAEASWLSFVLVTLASWRVVHLLVYDRGPFHIIEWFRGIVGLTRLPDGRMYAANTLAELFSCPWCMSVWVGLAAGLLWLGLTGWAIVAALAISACVSMLEMLTQCLLD